MKRICYSPEKETHFYEKGFALSHVSKVSFCNSEMAYLFSRGFNHLSSKDDSNKNYSKLDIEYSIAA